MEIIMVVGHVLSGRYQIEELLDSGGMARVWRGRDLRLGRPVAIKELAGPWDRTALQRFDREARMVARLAHPNIVVIYDVGSDGDSRYLVMELVEGATVEAMLADGPLPVAQAVAIAAQACDGLAAAHEAGIIHRDIKPANLMLTPAGVLKICDFGIARALLGMADTSLTAPATAMGSSKYMAPEQAYGDHIDARADLYALGCTMYAMLTGAPPFSGDNAVAILHLHLTQPPAPLREHRADIPPPLEALVAQLLEKVPSARPADATEVKTRLLALSQDSTTEAIPVSATAPIAVVPPPRAVAPPVVPEPPGVESPASRSRAARNWRMATAVVTTALAAVLIFLLVVSRSAPDSAADPPAASPTGLDTPAAASVTASSRPQAVPRPSTVVTPRRTASPSATVQPSSPTPPADPIATMRLSIQQQVNTGNLNPDAASDLYHRVDDIAREISEGDTDDATKKVNEFRDKLSSLLDGGKLSAAGYDTLIRDLDRIAATLS